MIEGTGRKEDLVIKAQRQDPAAGPASDRRKTPVLRQARQGFKTYFGQIIEIIQEI